MESRQNEEHNRGGHNEITHSSQSPRKKRGKTITNDVHSLAPGDRLVVTFNERGQPYGEMQPTLANFVGTIARNGNVLPLDFSDWRKMPKRCLDDAWERLTASFDILDQHRASVMQMMGVSWRRWKTQIKATSYDPNIPLRELVSIRPMTLSQKYGKLCSTSRINRENGSKKRGIHAQGWTNIASLEYKFFQENGRKPTRIEILHLSRQSKKKGGALVDDEAIRVEDLLNDAVQRHLQDKPEGTQPTEVHEDAFREIFGLEHSGRVRCLGAGALPSQVFPDQYKSRLFLTQSNLPTSDVTNKLREMEDKMKNMEERRLEEMERMRQIHEHQLQNFTRVIQSMITGSAGGSRGPELLPT
ncbi:uncharacterized protein LOC142541992 [Primulina tabacum]|uniref:uncharacterized protein LOC142541992 n=1 Tax=Primulina tabacum TaxID=48773 RepID=UPI003F59B5AF